MILNGFFAVSGKDAFRASAPTITIDTTTNYNQDRATFNATVNPNGATTSVKFQYSTNGSSWTDGATISSLTGTSQSVYSNQTSLSVGTLYYVRAIATNSVGSNTSSSTTFTTWALQTFDKVASGTWNFTIPTITPTGGSAIAPSIVEVQLVGAGGGGYNQGGGGGGGAGYAASSLTFASGSSTAISAVVGAGGGAASSGGASSISNLGVSAAGGGGASTDIYNGLGGYSGSGNAGGANWAVGDKNGNTTGWAGGGGGGNAGVGIYGNSGPETGGNGGGWSYCTYGGGIFGGGGGGDGRNGNGASGGGYYGVGGNGEGSGSGSPGRVHFKYYASTALA